jgi:hypothetical protein
MTGFVCATIHRAGRIHVGDVLALRHSMLGKARPSHHDANSIAGLAVKNFPACEQWREFFIETIAAYLVEGAAPRGELTEENAAWLIERCEDGLEETLAFELAATVVQRAANCPAPLLRYVLERLNELSARVHRGVAKDDEKAALDAARAALRAAGLAGRLYVPREAPAAPAASPGSGVAA